jgi:hypothetical protein
MKGGKAGKARGRTIRRFPETHLHFLGWLVRLAAMLHDKDPKALELTLPPLSLASP